MSEGVWGTNATRPGYRVAVRGAWWISGSADGVAGALPSDHLLTLARTSRADRIRYSSPPYFTSVPPYLE